VGERATRVFRLFRPKLQMKEVTTKFQPVGAAIDDEVVVRLEMLIVAGGEDRRISHRVVQTARRNLREAHVARIARNTKQSNLAGKINATIDAQLTAADGHPAKPQL